MIFTLEPTQSSLPIPFQVVHKVKLFLWHLDYLQFFFLLLFFLFLLCPLFFCPLLPYRKSEDYQVSGAREELEGEGCEGNGDSRGSGAQRICFSSWISSSGEMSWEPNTSPSGHTSLDHREKKMLPSEEIWVIVWSGRLNLDLSDRKRKQTLTPKMKQRL